MTPSDFMNRYRDYRTREESVAVAERDKVNAEGIEDDMLWPWRLVVGGV